MLKPVAAALLLMPLAAGATAAQLPANTWVQLAEDAQGARRFSSFRYVNETDTFLLWGFMGHLTDDYGSPDHPWNGNREYDMVEFDLTSHQWRSHLPRGKEAAWSRHPPPVHECNSYQGITTGSYRTGLVEREGVLRPDLNIVFDQLAYDTKRARLVYFTGGRTLAYYVRNRAWSDAAPDGPAPPPVTAATLAYDPVSDRIVLAAGAHVAETGADGKLAGYTGTWIFDCASNRWGRLTGSPEPPPRMNTRLVYDSKHRLMVLFAGDGQSRYLNDTWLFDTAARRWRKSTAPGTPPPRAGHFTVFDPSTGWVIAGGGYNRRNLDDMWAYDAGADRWKKLRAQVPTGWHITADIAPQRNLILLTTATKAEGDHSTCNEIYPVRTTYAFRIDPQGLAGEQQRSEPRGVMWKRTPKEALAGTARDAERAHRQAGVLGTMPFNQWVPLDNPGRNGVLRTWGSCTIDTGASRLIYWGGGHCGYGGSDYDLYDLTQNTWLPSPVIAEYPERAWDKGVNPAGVTFSGAPFVRHGRKVYAWDPVSKLIVNTKTIMLTAGYHPDLLAGIRGEEQPGKAAYRKWVTMTYNPAKEEWNLLCSGVPGLDLIITTPHGVMGVDHHWDNVDQKNEAHAPNSVYLLDVAARRWKKLPNPGPWPENLYEMTALVYDSRRDQLLLHGAGPRRDELWRYSLAGSRWEKLEPGGAPAPVCRREAVYLPDADVMLTASGGSLYAYHPGRNRWRKLAIPPPPGRPAADLDSQNRAWAFDPAHNVVLMVLGSSHGDTGTALVYALRYRGDIIASSR